MPSMHRIYWLHMRMGRKTTHSLLGEIGEGQFRRPWAVAQEGASSARVQALQR